MAGTFSGFWDDTTANIWTASDSATGINMYLYPSADATGKYIYGPAWLDASISVGTAQAVTISGSFAANGLLAA